LKTGVFSFYEENVPHLFNVCMLWVVARVLLCSSQGVLSRCLVVAYSSYSIL